MVRNGNGISMLLLVIVPTIICLFFINGCVLPISRPHHILPSINGNIHYLDGSDASGIEVGHYKGLEMGNCLTTRYSEYGTLVDLNGDFYLPAMIDTVYTPLYPGLVQSEYLYTVCFRISESDTLVWSDFGLHSFVPKHVTLNCIIDEADVECDSINSWDEE